MCSESPYKMSIIDVHHGFVCVDCRQSPIIGPRYHCKSCKPSYDLCSKCIHYEKNHSPDEMIKFSTGPAGKLQATECGHSMYAPMDGLSRSHQGKMQGAEGSHFMDAPMDGLRRFLQGKMQKAEGSHFMAKYKENVTTPKYWTCFHSQNSLKDWNSKDIHVKRHSFTKIPIKHTSNEFKFIENIVMQTWESDLFLIGRDSQGLKGLGYEYLRVKEIERLENPDLFERYAQERARLFNKAAKKGSFKGIEDTRHANKGPIATADFVPKQLLYTEINEHYLLHGTKEDNIDLIATQGFEPRLAEKTMFGPGVYFAESSTKADQYADSRDHRTKKGIKVMLLNRVCLGEIYVEKSHEQKQWRRPPCITCVSDRCTDRDHNTGNTGFYDSVVNDSKLIFREFIVYSKDACYPEYIIYYERV